MTTPTGPRDTGEFVMSLQVTHLSRLFYKEDYSFFSDSTSLPGRGTKVYFLTDPCPMTNPLGLLPVVQSTTDEGDVPPFVRLHL